MVRPQKAKYIFLYLLPFLSTEVEIKYTFKEVMWNHVVKQLKKSGHNMVCNTIGNVKQYSTQRLMPYELYDKISFLLKASWSSISLRKLQMSTSQFPTFTRCKKIKQGTTELLSYLPQQHTVKAFSRKNVSLLLCQSINRWNQRS